MRARTIAIAAVACVAVLATAVATLLLARQGATQPSSPAPTGTLTSPAAGTSAGLAPTPTAAAAAPDSQTGPSGQPPVEIGQVLDAGNLDAELVIIYNRGELVNLSGWTLSDGEGVSFVFPDLTLFPGGEVRLRSASGASGPAVIYWGRMESAWGKGNPLTLRDAEGGTVDTYVVP